MREMLPYGRQNVTDADIEAVAIALRSAMITQGPRVAGFEDALATVVGAQYAVAFNSGTAALHAAYFASGVGEGAEVITSPITFAATANASYYLGGRVRYVDIDPASALIDPAELRKVKSAGGLTVVAPIHFGGQVADMGSIARVAGDRGWAVVEDAAHALGARYLVAGVEHRVGACAHSSMCCFSFHPVKHITTGEGGAVTTNDPALRDRLARFRSHGITRNPAEMRVNEGPWYYEQHDLGFNYRITDFQCELGRSQLERLGEIVARRRAIAAKYDALFSGNEFIFPLQAPSNSRGSYHLYVVQVPAEIRRSVFDLARENGLGVNVHYIPVYHHPYHKEKVGEMRLESAEAYYERAITLPLFPEMTDSEVGRVVEIMDSAVRRCLVP
jgi:UDP-4-amino-4,6-dideoxy-N-acetyl-beta-L-altrosamine transaminase